MPKAVLNVEKLENKFQTLSRSRESIQGLSTWIMHHKEVHQEIVEQWLNCISKNCNTLAMFYVANEVIQGCGKKKCPEYREAFSKVLEEAASYEHVKEIKDRVVRLLKLWKERNIYDKEFSRRIENKLNSSEKEESSEEESSSEEEELSEQEIIKQFKKQNLIDELEKIKSFECIRKEKEDILNYADVPELPNLEDIIVRMDCQDTLRKCDAYLKIVEDCTELIRKEMSMRKKLLKELKNNCVFYSAQQKDVKEVANAFRVYGKRVKLMETRLAEKITTFPLPRNSPCFSEDLTVSPSTGVSSYDTDDASKSTQSPINELNQRSCGASNSKIDLSFSDKVPSEAGSKLSGNVVLPVQEKSTDESIIPKLPKSNFSKITELIEETKSNNESDFEKQRSILSEEAEKTLDIGNTNIFQDQTINCSEKLNDIPLKKTDLMEEIKSFKARETKQIPIKEKELTGLLDKKNNSIGLEQKTENSLDKSTSVLPTQQTCTTEQKEQSDSNPSKSQAQGNEDVDFLLEDSFDKKSKTKLSYKRKIESLLNSKGKKHCSTKMEKSQVEISKGVSIKVVDAEERHSECSQTQNEFDKVSKLNSSEKNIDITISSSESVSDNLKHCDESINATNTFIGSSICSNNERQPEKETTSFNPSGTFTGADMSSFISSMCSADPKQPEREASLNPSSTFTRTALSSFMPTDMCSEDLKHVDESVNVTNTFIGSSICSNDEMQPENETMSFNPSSTFTGADMSSFISSMCSADPKQPEREDLLFDPSSTFTKTALSSFMPTDMCSEDTKQPETKSLPFNPSGTSTRTALSSFMPTDKCSEDVKQPEKAALPFNPSSTFTGTALSSFMSTDTVSEDPKPTEKEILPSDTFTGSALSSFMSGVSTDFLKNILQKNNQNTNTLTKAEPDQKALIADSKTPEQKTLPSIPHNLKNNDTPKRESPRKDCVNSVEILKADSCDNLQTFESAATSEYVKTETQASLHIELSQSSSDTASKSVYSDKPNSSLSAEEMEGIPSTSNCKKVVPSENSKLGNTNRLMEKSNLLETLQNVLECLSENIQSKCDVNTFTKEERTELGPPLPLESVLKIYKYLHGNDTKFINDNKSSCLQANSNTSNKNTVSIVNASSTENNYEVMDMDCDSEDEMM